MAEVESPPQAIQDRPVASRAPGTTPSGFHAATLVIVVNAVGLLLFLIGRSDRILSAVIDTLHPDRVVMEQAFAAYALFAVSLVTVAGIALLKIAQMIVHRRRPRFRIGVPSGRRQAAAPLALAAGLTALIVLVLIEVLIFQDYGVHFYEFDVFGTLADAAFRRDLGIQPAEVARVVGAAALLLVVEGALWLLATRVVRWRGGALARSAAVAMLTAVPAGFVLFRASELGIASDRAEFEGALPFGRQLLLRQPSRPHIGTVPRLGENGYPVIRTGVAAPTFARKANILFFVADGLRGDMFGAELTPNLERFSAHPNVITSRRHFSTGHVSEAGVFGLLYGIQGHAYHAFMQARVPAYPIEVLKRNGYHTYLLASSRLSPYPSDQLVRVFDEVTYPANDDEAIAHLERYLQARRADGRPYFVFAFFYTPHYPFTSAKPPFRRFPLVGKSARPNYMNDVLQADEYFRQAFNLVAEDFERGHTVVLATSDHGEEIRDHGVFGHASATFWNEKIVVPFLLGLRGATLSESIRAPRMSEHVDVWPTLFDYLGARPALDATSYSDGRSLLRVERSIRPAYVAGRFFPYADRPSVLVDDTKKYWFRVTDVRDDGRLCVSLTRVTDLEDRSVAVDRLQLDPAGIPAFARLQAGFWRFVEPRIDQPAKDARNHSRTC